MEDMDFAPVATCPPSAVTGSPAMDGRTAQQSLLLAVPLAPGPEVLASLERLLDRIAHPPGGEDLEANPIIPFARLASVHFARILISRASDGPPTPVGGAAEPEPRIPDTLLFATDFDGTLEDHLFELIDVVSTGLDMLFGHCEGWSALAPRDRATRYAHLAEFVTRHSVVANTFYTGTMKRSVAQIRREAVLRDAIDEYLDAHVGRPGFPTHASGIRNRVCGFVFNDPRFAWVHARPGPFPSVLLPEWAVKVPARTALMALAIVDAILIVLLHVFLGTPWVQASAWVVGTTAAVALAGYRYLRYLEARDPVIIRPTVQQRTTSLVVDEDHIVQNQFTSNSYIKRPLWFRRGLLKLVLAFVNLAAKYRENQGTLSGIPSIHFARWVVVDRGRRLLFFSNFDGSWESYLGDFVDKAHEGLTAIWSNTVGFPKTVALIGGGASDEQRFKAVARDSQIATQVWYSAYPSLTVSNINDNTRLRLGLYGEMDDAAAEAWLRMSVPRTPDGGPERPPTLRPKVDLADVQGLVARSYRDSEIRGVPPSDVGGCES